MDKGSDPPGHDVQDDKNNIKTVRIKGYLVFGNTIYMQNFPAALLGGLPYAGLIYCVYS